ncbi:MAG: glycosyltransferase family 39 protein [Niastella sp.]|uniref:glycosyltransferase family 39 protein n=1 Tax=Niastella sp. TaxID=1869183 RepID=UPI0038998DBC
MNNLSKYFVAERIGKKEWIIGSILLFLFIVRSFLVFDMGLMPQDAYYFFYSEHLDLSYFDHPSGIAWVLWLFTSLLGKKVFVVKLAATLVTFCTQAAFVILATCFMNVKGVVQATILLFSTILISVVSLIATPDVPLLLFWTLSIIALYQAIFQNKKGYWLLAGVLMGLAFNSKYTAVFLPAGLLMYLVLSPEHRKLLRSYWPYLSLLLFAIMTMPVIIWNYNHDFASIKFQSVNRAAEASSDYFNITNILGVIGHQAFLLVPVLMFALFWMLRSMYKKYRLKLSTIPAQQLFLFSFFAPIFIGFLFIAVFYWVKINWMMPAYITGIILASMYIKPKWVQYQLIASLVIHFAMAVEIIFYPFEVKSDDTWVGWDQLADNVKEIKKGHPDYFIFSADDYKTSAVLNFYFDEMVYSKNIIGEPALQFDYVNTDLQTLQNRNAIFIDSHPDLSPCGTYPPVLNKYFTQITPLPPILVKKGGKVVRAFCVYVCMKYKP